MKHISINNELFELLKLYTYKKTYFVRVSNDEVYIEPPTSICTGAVYRDAAATQGIPEIL